MSLRIQKWKNCMGRNKEDAFLLQEANAKCQTWFLKLGASEFNSFFPFVHFFFFYCVSIPFPPLAFLPAWNTYWWWRGGTIPSLLFVLQVDSCMERKLRNQVAGQEGRCVPGSSRLADLPRASGRTGETCTPALKISRTICFASMVKPANILKAFLGDLSMDLVKQFRAWPWESVCALEQHWHHVFESLGLKGK